MSDWLVQNHDALEALGGLSAFLGLCAVVFGGLFGLYRLAHDRQQALNLSARALYYDYCRMSLGNPEYFLNYWGRSDLSDVERQRYVRFVLFMINGIEDIFTTGADGSWRTSLREDFRPHVSFLQSPAFDALRPYFFQETRNVIDSVIAEEKGRLDA